MQNYAPYVTSRTQLISLVHVFVVDDDDGGGGGGGSSGCDGDGSDVSDLSATIC